MHSNDFFLSAYGFTLDSKLTHKPDYVIHYSDLKLDLFGKIDLNSTLDPIRRMFDGIDSRAKKLKPKKIAAKFTFMLSKDNELKSINLLLIIIKKTIASYGFTKKVRIY